METADGRCMLLRVSGIEVHDRKKADYEMMKRVYELGVPTSQPLGFGTCNGEQNIYALSGWLDGEDLEVVLPLMPETAQHATGVKAGKILQKIHALHAPMSISDWQGRYFGVIDERIEAYHSKGVPFEGNGVIIDYIEQNRGLLKKRPQSFIHGDFHEGNLIVTPDGSLHVIDFLDEGFGNHGDAWYDFKTFGENDNAYFSTGLVQGYFDGEPPQAFWDVLMYYYITAAFTAIVWTKYNKPEELPETIKWNERNAQAIQEGRSPLMKWYLKDDGNQ